MDFAEILSSQFSHQEIKVLKILSSYHAHFQNFDCIHYGPFNPNTYNYHHNFWHFQNALIQPVLTVNFLKF